MLDSKNLENDVFISYNSADEQMAKKIGQSLEGEKIGDRNIKVFFAPWDIKKGENFITNIDEGLGKARFYALVLSPEALNAEWPTAERAAALLSDPSGRMGRVIPILVKSCNVPPLLAIRNWLDLREKSKFKTEMQKMLCTVRGEPLPRGEVSAGSKIIIESGPSVLMAANKASEPDQTDETLHTNLFPVTKLPSVIWKAPTTFWEKSSVYTTIGGEIRPFILREKHLFTFSNLNDNTNRLRLAVDATKIESVNVKEWFGDEDKSRWLISLLGSETSKFCKNIGLYFDSIGGQFYGDKKKITDEKFSWTAHVRKGKRGLIIPYSKINVKTGEETTYFYRHRAIGLRFIILGNELFFQLEPGWEFSIDGSILIKGKRRSVLNTRLQSRIKNDVEFDEMRFWAWLLSDGTKISLGNGESTIEIDLKPLAFKTNLGIFGDKKPIPDVVEEPPALTVDADDDSEILITDEELDEDVKEIDYNDV